MTLLPVRVLPVNDAPGGAFLIRVDMDARAAAIYVRRQSDKKTWVCEVRSLQEILAPTQQARALDLLAVVTCLYHGAAHDTSSFLASSIDLVRREVAFTQPASWTGDSYRLTARIAVRTVTTVVATPVTATPAEAVAVRGDVDGNPPAAMASPTVAVAEPADDDVVFGFNFTACNASIERTPVDFSTNERRSVRLELIGVAFPLRFLNWLPSAMPVVAVTVRDGVFLPLLTHMEATLTIVHTKGPVHFVMSSSST